LLDQKGRQTLHVGLFACDATIHCKRYHGNSPDEPLSTTGFAGGVTFTIQVELVVDLASRNVEDHPIGDLAWNKWNNWSENKDLVNRYLSESQTAWLVLGQRNRRQRAERNG